jgi:hypothetical protein
LHEALIVVDDGIDDSISDSFSHNLLGLVNAVETQLLLDVGHGDLGITDVQFFKTKLKDCVLKSHD